MPRRKTTTRWRGCGLLCGLLLICGGCRPEFDTLARDLKSKDWRKREGAAYMLKHHGRKGVPLLIKALTKDRDHRVRRAAAVTLGRLGFASGVPALRRGLRDESFWVRRECARSIGEFGPRAADAAPDVIHTWGDADHRVHHEASRAWDALKLAPDRAMTLLQAGLKASRWRSRSESAARLGRLGPKARRAEPVLTAALADAHHKVRMAAATALGRAGKSPVAPLAKALFDPHPKVRSAAAKALTRFGKTAPAAVDALAKALKDADWRVGYDARMALVAIGEPAVPVVAALLQQTDREQRKNAFLFLAEMGPKAHAAVPAVIAVLNGPKKTYARYRACDVLEKIGPRAEAAVPALMTAFLEDPKGPGNMRRRAANALSRMGARAVAPLVKALGHEMQMIRMRAAEALGGIGPSARPAVSALVRVLKKDPERWVREAAAKALGGIGPGAAPAVDGLLEAARSFNATLQANAAEALGRIGVSDRRVVETLKRLNKNPVAKVSKAARKALNKLSKK